MYLFEVCTQEHVRLASYAKLYGSLLNFWVYSYAKAAVYTHQALRALSAHFQLDFHCTLLE